MQEKIKAWLQRVANADQEKRKKLLYAFVVSNVLGVGLVLSGLYAVGGPGTPFAVLVVELIGVGVVVSVGLNNWRKIAKPLCELLNLKVFPETFHASLLFMTLPAILVGDLINIGFSLCSSGGIRVISYLGIAILATTTLVIRLAVGWE